VSNLHFYNLDFSQLSYFIAAAEHLNFSKAAAECHVVPNVISKQIANLEARLGTPLFNRIGKRVSLTEAGKIFYKCAQDILTQFASSIQKINDYDPSINMHIRLAYYSLWSETVISPIVRDFKIKYPNAFISIRYINLPQILPLLNNEFLDAAIISPFKINNPTIDSFILDRSPINLCVSSLNPLSQKDEIGLDELKDEYFTHVTFPQPSIDKLKNSLSFDEDFAMYIDKYYTLGLEQCQYLDNVLDNIRADLGFGFLPEAAKSDYTERLGIKFIKIKEKVPFISMHMIWSKNNTNSALPLFLDVARNHISIKT